MSDKWLKPSKLPAPLQRREMEYGIGAWIDETLKLGDKVRALKSVSPASNEDICRLVTIVLGTQQELRRVDASVQALKRRIK